MSDATKARGKNKERETLHSRMAIHLTGRYRFLYKSKPCFSSRLVRGQRARGDERHIRRPQA